jgi:hydrogenase/urease accessory protein HupE
MFSLAIVASARSGKAPLSLPAISPAGTLLAQMRPALRSFLLAVALLSSAPLAHAHPAPFSYLDLHLNRGGLTGTLVVHDFDAATDLADVLPDELKDPAIAAGSREALIHLLSPRISLNLDGQDAPILWGALETVPDRQSLRLAFTVAFPRPARVQVRALVFPYDPKHQTFVNIYEDGRLAHQAILDVQRQAADYYSGSTQGRLAVVKTFVLSGIEHILIGPDHVLFLVGLLLLRGTITRLALIVTAFTLGHSVTLSLAALDVISPPSRLIEPLIALTIIVVGADNLLVLRGPTEAGRPPKDIRAGLAGVFGLIHGFGFASVLKEFGLPRAALGWSLFAFNLGVEIGQLAIVAAVAFALALLAKRSHAWALRVARLGSIAVIAAGAFWFIERTFFPGG